MAAAPLHAPIHRTPLIRLLDQWSAGVPAPEGSLAARMAPWLDFTDAIALHAALAPPRPAKPVKETKRSRAAPPAKPSSVSIVPNDPNIDALHREAQRVRSLLRDMIDNARSAPGNTRFRLPQVTPDMPPADIAFTPYRRYLQLHQQAFTLHLPPLRESIRNALAQSGGAARSIATLDAALERALAPREQRLMGRLVDHLEHRFATCRTSALSAWHERFLDDLHALLHAELAARFECIDGLLAALPARSPVPNPLPAQE